MLARQRFFVSLQAGEFTGIEIGLSQESGGKYSPAGKM
jgi:hypothetical protein